jgi:antitoxin component of MazEF toxin-antitoxin module
MQDHTAEKMTSVKFVSTISQMGGRLIINIPASFKEKVEVLKGKQIRVVIDDEI